MELLKFLHRLSFYSGIRLGNHISHTTKFKSSMKVINIEEHSKHGLWPVKGSKDRVRC